jgi:hypothetical protein
MTSSRFAGFVLVKVAPDSAAVQSAPMRFWYRLVTWVLLLGGREAGRARLAAGPRFYRWRAIHDSRAGRDIRPFTAPTASRMLRPQLKNRRDGFLLNVTGLK